MAAITKQTQPIFPLQLKHVGKDTVEFPLHFFSLTLSLLQVFLQRTFSEEKI